MDRDDLLTNLVGIVNDWSNEFNECIGGYFGCSVHGNELIITAEIVEPENDCSYSTGKFETRFKLVPIPEDD